MSPRFKTPGRGKWLYTRASAHGNSDGTDSFDVEGEGGTYLFLFPFDIYVEDISACLSLTTESRTYRTYPPFQNDTENALSIEQLRKELVPGPPSYPTPGLGTPAFESLLVSHPLGERTNAVRIDFVPDLEAQEAINFVALFVGWLRGQSGQWWINRDRAHALQPLRSWFGISAEGQRATGFHSFYSHFGGFGIEKPVDDRMYSLAFQAAVGGREIPLSHDALMDAMHHHASHDSRRAVLDAAIACEAGIGEEFRRIADRDGHSITSLKKATASNDFTVQLETATERFQITPTFKSLQPLEHKWLEQLRTARGNVAHGGPLRISAEDGRGRQPNVDELFSMIDAARVLLNWLKGL